MDIVDISGKEWSVNCIGCAMAAKTFIPPGNIIKETQNFILSQDPEVPIKGFLIISSKKHIKSIIELTPEEAKELFELCYSSRSSLAQIDDIIECTLIQEERSNHFHMWILPRYKWMNDLFSSSLIDIRAIMKYAKENLKTPDNIDDILNTVGILRGILN